MAPKRKAAEPANGDQTNVERTQDIASESGNASGTLAGASGQSVDTLLGRVGNKRLKAMAAKGLRASSSAAFPSPKPRTVAEAVCGAPSQVNAASVEQRVAQQKDQPDDDDGVASASDWEWEDAAEDEEDWETAEADVSVSASGVAGSFDVEASDKAGPSRPRRKGITKEERDMARLLHRTHLLCLLSRGLLFDQAASDSLLQATLLSLDSPQVAASSDPTQGVASSALQPLLSWFIQTFQQQPAAPVDKPASDDEFAAPADGLHGVLEQLQAVVAAKQGTAEQLQALFVAVCRAQGLLVRSVRVLDAMPLHPGVRRSASAHLKQPRRPKPKADKSATASTDGSAATAEQSGDKRRGRKRKSAESVGIVAGLNEPADDGSKASKAVAKQKGKKKQGNASNKADASADAAAQQPAKGTAPAKSSGGKRKAAKGKKRETDEADLQLQDDLAAACAASLTTAETNGSDQKPAKRVGDIELENQLAMAMASTAAEAKHKTQRTATVHDEPMPSAFSPRAGGRKPTLGETWARDARLANQDLAQSKAANHWAEVFCGSAETGKWIHVDPLLGWIDAPDKVEGAGIRSCILSLVAGCIIEPGSVASPAMRPGGLAYVVAFASSGAKDVTQRYVGSVLAADKMRDNAWWEETLRPLRKHEVAATTLHHKALQLTQSQGATTSAASHYLQSEVATSVRLSEAEGQLPATLPHTAVQGRVRTALPNLAGPSRGVHGTDSKLAARAAELVLKREDAELSHRAASERQGLPSNVEGFKHHPVYVLERHISRYFALKPGTKKAGMHRGEAFYPREALAELHTADRWLRDGLEVRPEELSKPYKVVKRRGVKDVPQADPNRGNAEEEEGQEEPSVIRVPDAMVTKMYGRWQTQQWQVPTAVGGVVPKNDRGNVHCPPLASELPKGTVHLQMPRLGPICKKLGLDYAPAMTGFDIKGGRSVPVIEGVVVCKEDEATVLEAYLEDERLREERAAERRKLEADAAWRQLLRSIWTRLRLNQDYGDNAAAHAGQDHAHMNVTAPKEELSGGSAELVDLVEDQAGPSTAEIAEQADATLLQDHGNTGQQLHDDAGERPATTRPKQKRLSRGSTGKQKAVEKAVNAAPDTEEESQAQAGTKLKRHSKTGIEVEMEEI